MLVALVSIFLSFAVHASPAIAETIRVALLPVVVHTSEPESAYLSEGLGDMLSARIERSGEVTVLRIADLATTNPPEAVAAAKEVGAAYVLYGSFTQFGAGASLDIRCAPASVSESASGEGAGARHIFIQTGTLQEIIPKLNDLSDKIIRYIVSGANRIGEQPKIGSPGELSNAEDRNSSDSLAELRSRVDALERTVYSETSELGGDGRSSVAEAR